MNPQIKLFQPRWLSRLKSSFHCYWARYKTRPWYEKVLDRSLTIGGLMETAYLLSNLLFHFSPHTLSSFRSFQICLLPLFAIDMTRTAVKGKKAMTFAKCHMLDLLVLGAAMLVVGWPVYLGWGRNVYRIFFERLHEPEFYDLAKVQKLLSWHHMRMR